LNVFARRSLFALLFVSCSAWWNHAAAQSFPTRPVRIIVPFAPGGATDITMRMLAPRLSENLGQSVVVENRPGGATTIGMDLVAKSTPDGHTLGTASFTFTVNPSLFSKLPYNTERDFVPVTQVAHVPLVLSMHPSIPARSIKELVALAKAKPGSLNFSSSGNGSSSQMSVELIKYMTGTNMVHIPFTGGGPALVAVLGGQVSFCFVSVPAGQPHYKSGRLVPLGISSAKRNATIPDVPTIAESGLPGYEVMEWSGLVAPAGTPAAIVNRLYKETAKALSAPDLNERYSAVGAYPVGSSPEEMTNYIKQAIPTWAKVIKAAGIKFD
jgi:tripartite-type tricarboxylate transporter receptor subunit TctC